jgi:hypothetical protein
MCSGNCNCSCDQVTIPSITGPAGVNGLNAFTTTTAQFIVPAIGANVTLAVSNSNPSTGSWAVPGQSIYIENAGYYTVVSSTTTSIVVTNTGTTGNTAPGTTVASGQQVSPAGVAQPQSGTILYDYFGETAGTGSFQLFNGAQQSLDYTKFALSTNQDELNIKAFIYTPVLLVNPTTFFRFRIDGSVIFTTVKFNYYPFSRITFDITLNRVSSTGFTVIAKQYISNGASQTTVLDYSQATIQSISDLDNPGTYPLTFDFQVDSDVNNTLVWQSLTSNKKL